MSAITDYIKKSNVNMWDKRDEEEEEDPLAKQLRERSEPIYSNENLSSSEKDALVAQERQRFEQEQENRRKQEGLSRLQNIDSEVDRMDLRPDQAEFLKTSRKTQLIRDYGLTPQDINLAAQSSRTAAAQGPQTTPPIDFQGGPGTAPPAQSERTSLEFSRRGPGRGLQNPLQGVSQAYKTLGEKSAASMEAQAETQRTIQQEQTQIYREARSRQEELQQQLKERQKVLTHQEDKLRRASQEVQDFKETETSVGQRIGMAIAAALAGFAGGRAGDPTAGVKVAQQMIQNRIDEDKRKYARLKDKVSAEQNMLGYMRQRFADEDTAEQALRIAYNDTVQKKLDSLIAGSKSEEIKAQLEQVKAQLDVDKQNTISSIKLKMNDQLIEQQKFKAMQEKKPGIDYRIPGMTLNVDDQGRPERIPTEKEVKDLVKGRANVSQTLENILTLKEHVREHGWEWRSNLPGVLQSESASRGKALATNLQLLLKEAFALGVLSAQDIEMVSRLVGDEPGQFRSDLYLSTLNTLEERVRTGWSAKARSSGYRDLEYGVVKSFRPLGD